MFGDSFFKKVENKTNVNKDTILSLASKVQKADMKDEKVLRELIHDIANVAGKEVSEEKTQKIIKAVKNDQVPQNMDGMF